MPTKPSHPCKVPTCPELTDDGTGYCKAHAVETRKTLTRWVGTSKERGYGADWQKVRLKALERDAFLCCLCLSEDNRMYPAQEVHHLVPIKTDPSLRLELSNLQSLCRSHHRRITFAEQQQDS